MTEPISLGWGGGSSPYSPLHDATIKGKHCEVSNKSGFLSKFQICWKHNKVTNRERNKGFKPDPANINISKNSWRRGQKNFYVGQVPCSIPTLITINLNSLNSRGFLQSSIISRYKNKNSQTVSKL